MLRVRVLRTPGLRIASLIFGITGVVYVLFDVVHSPDLRRVDPAQKDPGTIHGFQSCPMSMRLQRVQQSCSTTQHLPQLQPRMLSLILVDDDHRVLYCAVPKAGSTSWKTLFATLTGKVDPKTLLAHQVESYSFMGSIGLKFLSSYGSEEVRYRLENYYKMMVVRHPLERLVSAFRDKINRRTTYGAEIKEHIISKYVNERLRSTSYSAVFNHTTTSGRYAGHNKRITFADFVKYILEEDKGKGDHHWSLFSHLCHPCHIHYDVIVKSETMETDAKATLAKISKEVVSLPKLNTRVHRPRRVFENLKEFSTLTQSEFDGLLKIYKEDMDMFGYSVAAPFVPVCQSSQEPSKKSCC